MLSTTAHAILQGFRDDQFVFGFSGRFSDELSGRLLDLSDSIIRELSDHPGQRRKLAFLLVEAYQNIIRHRAGLPAYVELGEGRSYFQFRANPEGQDLVAINGVLRKQVDTITEQLQAIRGMDHAELKELSLRLMQQPSTGRGAGVGFIEMKRRSGNELGHVIRGLGPEHAVFALTVRSGQAHSPLKVISEAALMHGTVIMNDILLFHTGSTPASVRTVLAHIVQHDVLPPSGTDAGRLREMAYSAGAEILATVAVDPRRVCVLAREAQSLVLIHGIGCPASVAQEILGQVKERLTDTRLVGTSSAVALYGDGPQRALLITTRF